MDIFFKIKWLLSILWLALIASGLPAGNHRNSQTSLDGDESRHFPTVNSGFLSIIPSQVDPRPAINIHTEPHRSQISAEQNFFPSFFRNEHHHQLSTSRPFSLRHASTSSLKHSTSPSTRTTLYDSSLLGSGDFTVLRGGTFYPEGEEKRNEYYGSGSSYYDTNTGRPFALPLERPHYSDDPFANFKDFADITAGIDSDFSHYIVVYANKNSTKHEPRNILEQLEMLDRQKEAEVSTSELPIKTNNKLSKIKMKLRSTKLEKKYKKDVKKSQNVDYVDPLVADS